MKTVIGLLPALFAIAVLAWCPSSAPTMAKRETGHFPGSLGSPNSSASGAFSSRDPSARLYPFDFDLRHEFGLPPLHLGGGDPAEQIARGTQVFQRAQLLNVDRGSADAAWATAGTTATTDRSILPTLLRRPLRKLTFNGARLSQLGALIATAGPADVTVASRRLQADTALTITGQNVVVDFSGAAIDAGPTSPTWLVKLVGARHVALVNAKINGGTNGLLVDSGSNIVLAGNEVAGLTENGIVVTGQSSELDIHANRLHDLNRAGIMLDGPVSKALLYDNEISDLRGHSNWDAGILLTGRGGDIAVNPDTFFLPGDYWVVAQPLVQRLQNPAHNVIMGNTIRDGLSSGIYDDGAIANVFLDNRIQDNSKEGICFDNGATANAFAGNLVAGNGRRWGQPDEDLALDSVLSAGRGADGTSLAKLPGVSLDNALYNEIYANDVMNNFGGGVKMVRTGLFNLVADNVIDDNDLGESPDFHFFGIELGAAPADKPAVDLDFVGSSGNIVFGNSIGGKHYSGIFFGSGSVQNDVFDNQISGVESSKMEAPWTAFGFSAFQRAPPPASGWSSVVGGRHGRH